MKFHIIAPYRKFLDKGGYFLQNMALEVLISSTNVTSEIETGKTGAFLSESGPQSSLTTVYLRYTQNRLRLIWGISHRKQRSRQG